jgi:hypothetical protein
MTDLILLDEYRSPIYLPHHAKIDQYQIYSLVVDDLQSNSTITTSNGGISYPFPDGNYGVWYSYTSFNFTLAAQTVQANRVTGAGGSDTVFAGKCTTFQSFCPYGQIPIDFAEIVRAYPAQRPRAIARNRIGLPDMGGGQTTGKQKSSYHDLITGRPTDSRTGALLDNRQLPKYYQGIAASTRRIKWGYYRRNPAENHPAVTHSLDWIVGHTDVLKGQPYKLLINGPCLGTLVLDSATQGELQDRAGDYPLALVLAGSSLQSLIDSWDDQYSEPPALEARPWADQFQLDHSIIEIPDDVQFPYQYGLLVTGQLPPANAITSQSEASFTPRPRILAANNDRWGHGTLTINTDPPEPNRRLFSNIDDQTLFYSPQPNGDRGTYIMEGPRTLEMHAAMNAGYYATDSSGNPRVANLGHLIERIAAMLGYRPKPNGEIDANAEKTTWARRAVSNDFPFTPGDYQAGRFGRKGLLLQRIPNEKDKTGQVAQGSKVAIHDLPQLLCEVLDQLNSALNLQESTSIQVKDGNQTYTYPNQLAALTEILTCLIPQRRQVREIWASSIVTQKSVNEVIAGMGLPVVSKQLAINNQLLPYWAIQPDKSLVREISASTHNSGIATGQLL